MPSVLYANIHDNFDGISTITVFVFGTPGDTVAVSAATGYAETAVIGADGSVSIEVPSALSMQDTGISDQGLKITSEGDISAYLSNREQFTTDLTVLFEEASLGTDYVLASMGGSIRDGGQFSAQATQDGTVLTFTLPDGQTADVTLDAGESFKFSTTDGSGNRDFGLTVSGNTDLTGTLLSANNPVAVFSGHGCANIGSGFCDHLVEQMPAIENLSQSYVVAEAFSTEGDGNNLVRVIAATDDTEVRIDGVLVRTLDAGAFYEFTLSTAARQIDVSNPALVAQYLQGGTTAGEGDPAMSFVPGSDTWLASYIVATPSGFEALDQNLINLIVPTSAVATVVLNGVGIPADVFSTVSGTDLSVANVEVDPGVIQVEAAQAFQLTLFGFDRDDSFLTFGGANFASGLSNVPPEPADDLFDATENTTLQGNLLVDNGNGPDRDRDDDPLTVTALNGDPLGVGSLVVLPSGASLTLQENGDFAYQASFADDLPSGETRVDTFTYSVTDGATTRSAQVDVTVTGVAELPRFQITLPDDLGPGEAGAAQVSFVSANGDIPLDAGGTYLFAITPEKGLVSDPSGAGFSDQTFVLAQAFADGSFDTFDVSIKGSAGPRSRLEASAQLANGTALTEIADRIMALQPDFLAPQAAARIDANLRAEFGDTVSSLTQVLSAHAAHLGDLGLNAQSATQALAFAIETAGDFGSLELRGTAGALGLGWQTLADIALEIDQGTVQMRGLADLSALQALSVDAAALYTVSNSVGRSVSLSGEALGFGAPVRPAFAQSIDGSFQSTSGFDGTLTKTDNGYTIVTDEGETLFFDDAGVFQHLQRADGQLLTAQLDDMMQITGFTGPNGASLTFVRAADGTVQSVQDADGQTAFFSYDAAGQLQSVTQPQGQSVFTYDDQGDLVSATAPGGIASTFDYDSMGRLQNADYGNGAQSETITYDGAGGVTITDGAGRSTQIDLLLGNVVGRVTDGTGAASEIIYDEAGGIQGVRAPDGTETGFEFDAQGRVTKITDANGAELGFGYAEDTQNPDSFTDAGGNTRSFEYDAAGRITQATWPDGSTLAFSYDDQGNLTSYENRRGDDVSYTYDARGRLLSETDGSAGPTTYIYDAGGRLVSASNDQGVTQLAYDAADRVVQIDYPTGKSLSYTYNDAGLRASMSDGDSYNVFYDYDALGRLAGLRDEDSQLVSYSYDAGGNLVLEENGNGTATAYTYDNGGRLISIENRSPDASVHSFNVYSYDVAGQRVSNDTQDGSWSYGYDAAGQLVSAEFTSINPAIADKSLSYAYDAAGNRTAVIEDGVETTYIANALNQYTTVGDATFTYDADGNMTTRSDGEGVTTYAYDLDNRLTSVTQADGTVLEFAYDLFGNRVSKSVDGAQTEYLVDPFGLGDVVSEFTDGTLSASYAHGLGLAAGEIGGVTAYYDADAVGTVTTLTGAGGAVENSYAFTPFGTEMFEVEGLANDFEFNGVLGVAEDADDLTFMRARSYSDELGRFLSEDPLWIDGSAENLYEFARNSPADLVDPQGELAFLYVPWVIFQAASAAYTGYTATVQVAEAIKDAKQGNYAGAVVNLAEAVVNVAPLPPIKVVGKAVKETLSDLGFTPQNVARLGTVLEDVAEDKVRDAAIDIIGALNEIAGDPKGKYGPDNDGDGFPDEWGRDEDGDGLPDNIPEGVSLIPPSGANSASSESDTTQTNPAGGNGRSDGDPHLATFDGVGYSFQAVGEFTLVLGDGFEIQTRQVAFGNSNRVSVNEALAMDIDGNTVGIYADEAIPLVINGTAVVMQAGDSIAVGDGSVYFDGRAYVLTDDSGNGVWVRVGSSFLNVRTFAAEGADIAGLLGNFNGDRTDDFQLRDGTVLPQPLPETVLYGAFADSWRVTQADSLFLYAEGETTETFTNRDFPTNIVRLSDLDPDIVAAAEAVALANGLTPGTFAFETTVLDVALTGSDEFAEGVGDAPDFTPEDEEPAEVTTVEINAAPDAATDVATVLQDGTILVDVLANDSDAEGDGLTLVEGSLDTNGTVSVEDGLLRITPDADFFGETTVRYTLADAAGNEVEGLVALTVTPQQIQIRGNGGPNDLVGGSIDNLIEGLFGRDTLTGQGGDDTLDGGLGVDTAVFDGPQSAYSLILGPSGTTITDRRSDGTGTDVLRNIEFLDFGPEIDLFGGTPMNLDVFDGPTGLDAAEFETIAELYIAYFNRAPDALGLFYWATEFAGGFSFAEIAESFFAQPETQATYASVLNEQGLLDINDAAKVAQFVTEVYANVPGRAPDQPGFEYWTDQLANNPAITPGNFILSLIGGAKNPTVPTPQTIADQAYIDSKTDLGIYFSVIKGMSDIADASEVMSLFDGTAQSLQAAIDATDADFQEALNAQTGDFLMPLVGVIDDPFGA